MSEEPSERAGSFSTLHIGRHLTVVTVMTIVPSYHTLHDGY